MKHSRSVWALAALAAVFALQGDAVAQGRG